VERLKATLGEKDSTEKAARRTRNAAITSLLKLHFEYVATSVTCNEAKPFLPSLADPTLQVRIPTPITAHVDNCRACSEDLSTIRQMALTHKQLCRLGQFLADKSEDRRVDCRNASEFVRPVAQGRLRQASAEVLAHLCACPHCRQVLYERRQELLAELSAETDVQSELSCGELSLTDLFEYCIPCGIDPAHGRAVHLRPEATAHLSACPKCLAQVQSLHKTVCGIAERPESTVATRFTMKAPMTEELDLDHAASATDWAVNIELCRSLPKPQPPTGTVSLPLRAGQAVARLNVVRFLRPVAIAAAAMLLISVLFLNTPAAKAVGLSQVYEAIAKIKNVCIARFEAGKTEPHQKEWVSQTMNIRMFQNTGGEEEFALWDIANGVKKARSFASLEVERTEPSPELLKKCWDAVGNSFGLMPFATMADVPKDAQWTRVDDMEIAAVVPGTEVYDLTWVEVNNDRQFPQRKRYWVDPKTGLPRRTDYYRRESSEPEYELIMMVEVECPTDSEIQALMRTWFGDDPLP
jgi:hypothetical protein